MKFEEPGEGLETEPCAEYKEYPEGTEFTLEPEPHAEPGSEFAGFSNGEGNAAACTGSKEPCRFTLTIDSSVDARFDLVAVRVKKAGGGSGTVTSSPGGISCGATCSFAFEEGEVVTLTATPAPGSTFAGWSGCEGYPAPDECEVTLEEEASATVTATFKAIPPVETCATNPSLCPPAEEEPYEEEEEGTARAAGSAPVRGGKAALKLTCSGGACKGSFKLTAKVKSGKRTKGLVIGKGSFSLASGASKTIKVKITNGQAKKLLKSGKTLKARVTGPGIEPRIVKLG